MASMPKMLWYSVTTEDQVVEYEMPNDPSWRTSEQRQQWDELNHLAAAHDTDIRSRGHKQT